MTALLAWFLTNPTVIAIGGGFIAAVVAYMRGQIVGGRKADAKRAADELRARDVADQVDSDIGALPPDLAREELRKWGKK